MTRYLFVLLAGCCFACSQKNNAVYSDAASMGCKGPVASIQTFTYACTSEKDGKWEADTSMGPLYRLDTYFNEQGNFTSRLYESPDARIKTIYDYSGGNKTWKKEGVPTINPKGKMVISGDSITETAYDSAGRPAIITVITLDAHKRIKTIVRSGRDKTGEPIHHNLITQYRDGSGILKKQVIEDNGKTVTMEYTTLEEDDHHNAAKILQITDGKNRTIYMNKFTYRQ